MFITRRTMTALDELRQIREDYGHASPSVFGMTAKTMNHRVKAAGQATGLGRGSPAIAAGWVWPGAPDSAIMRQGRWCSGDVVATVHPV